MHAVAAEWAQRGGIVREPRAATRGELLRVHSEDHLAAESVRLVAKRGDTQIVETHHGFVLAAAGIDASNVPDGTVALLPLDPDASARHIHDTLRA